jgi:hypothetical protein
LKEKNRLIKKMTTSVPPTFKFTTTGVWQKVDIVAATPVAGVEYMSVMLWGDDEEFNSYVSWAADSTNKPTSLQYLNSINYSGYVLSFKCNISAGTSATKDGVGCCLRDYSALLGGAYCVVYTDATVTATTYYLTDTQMNTAERTDFAISASYAKTINSSN